MTPTRDERGIALVMALMILLAISLLSVALMMTLQVEKKMTGEGVRYAQALNLAEAGLGEAMARINQGDVPNSLNPRMVTQIFLAPSGAVPSLTGPDSIPLPTAQPAGRYLAYSTPDKGPDVLTVSYKTDKDRTVIYRYDPTRNPPVNPWTGNPIFVIRSTGREGLTRRSIQTEVIQKPFPLNIYAAFAVNQGIDFSGNAQVCGYNHSPDTPTFTAGVHAAAKTPNCSSPVDYELGSDHLPGGWSCGSITSSGSALQAGSPSANLAGQTGFYSGPWDALGVAQPEFYSWIGAPRATMPDPAMGLFYLDNNGITQDASGSWSAPSSAGEGLLYVDGDLTVNANFVFRGVIYVEGDVKINGNSWVLGSILVRGKSRQSNGSMIVLYSRDAISRALSKFGSQFTTLSWREVR